MSLTNDLSSKANDNDSAGGVRREPTLLPRSPAEALEPTRPPVPQAPETPEARDHPVLGFFNGMFRFALVLAIAVAAFYYFLKIQFDQPGPLATSTVIVVPKGQSVGDIADALVRDGVIDDRRVLFLLYARYFSHVKGNASIKAGEYVFHKNASMRQVLDTLVEGKSIDHKVTVAEGLTSQQIVQRLNANADLEGEIAQVPAEGTLLPDTYRFQTGDTRSDIIERMQVGQQKFLAKMWEERDPDVVVKTPEEAIILASIVEKETGRADERPRIAAVFSNRLKKKMRLQSDPTIIYGLVAGQGALDHPIQQDELDRNTPYNTYKIDGLPPGPIANPGRAAIEAVLKPAKTKDLYFVADGKGGHAFAPSLDDHNKNVQKWRVVEREIRAREAQEAAAAAEAAKAAGVVPPDATLPGETSEAAPPADVVGQTGATPKPLEIIRTPAEAPAATAGAAPPPAGAAPPLPRRNPNR